MRVALSLLLAGAVAAFCQTASAPAKPKPAVSKAKTGTAKAKPKPIPLEPGLYAHITTQMGTVVTRLFEKEAPTTVKNFVELAAGQKEWTDPVSGDRVKRPLYDGLTFHRVIPGFMIQGGDPEGTGMGGTDVIPDEFDPNLAFDRPGRLGMANAGPDTGSSQFFITEEPQPNLNGRHTVFGQVVRGQDVVSRIARVERNEDDSPITPVRILRVGFQRIGPGPKPPRSPAATKAKPAVKRSKPATK
jgi:peptidyl-prolyl cis-trans isomerase A (cyclophilin A)